MKLKILGDIDQDVANRQKLFRGWRQEKLAEMTVLIAGAGALGNELIKDLVLLGVGKILVVDFDQVVASNLNRCVLFRKSDVKKQKVDVIAKRAKEIDPYGYVEIVSINKRIEDLSTSKLEEVDVFMSGLDNITSRMDLNAKALGLEKPLIDGGIESFYGHVQTVIPYKTACLYCSITGHTIKMMERGIRCSVIEEKIPAIVTTAAIISALMTQDLIKIALGLDHYLKTGKWPKETGEPFAGKKFFMNIRDNVYAVFRVEKNPKCPACGEV